MIDTSEFLSVMNSPQLAEKSLSLTKLVQPTCDSAFLRMLMSCLHQGQGWVTVKNACCSIPHSHLVIQT